MNTSTAGPDLASETDQQSLFVDPKDRPELLNRAVLRVDLDVPTARVIAFINELSVSVETDGWVEASIEKICARPGLRCHRDTLRPVRAALVKAGWLIEVPISDSGRKDLKRRIDWLAISRAARGLGSPKGAALPPKGAANSIKEDRGRARVQLKELKNEFKGKKRSDGWRLDIEPDELTNAWKIEELYELALLCSKMNLRRCRSDRRAVFRAAITASKRGDDSPKLFTFLLTDRRWERHDAKTGLPRLIGGTESKACEWMRLVDDSKANRNDAHTLPNVKTDQAQPIGELVGDPAKLDRFRKRLQANGILAATKKPLAAAGCEGSMSPDGTDVDLACGQSPASSPAPAHRSTPTPPDEGPHS